MSRVGSPHPDRDVAPAIERLRFGDAMPEEAWALMAAGEAEGHEFLAQVRRHWDDPAGQYADERAFVLLARLDGRVVAVAGLAVDSYAADPGTARLKHVYVEPAARRRGIAGALVRRILGEARGRWTRLRLRAADEGAARLYEGLGFSKTPDEPDCTHVYEELSQKAHP